MNKDEFQRPAGGGRKIFLVVLLLVVAGALAYDYLLAKPSWQKALERAQTMQTPQKDEFGNVLLVDGNIIRTGDVDSDGRVTPEDVRKFLECQPFSSSSTGENTLVETYSWRRGLPFTTYDLFVSYTTDGETVSLLSVSEKPPGEKYTTRQDRPEGLGKAGGRPKKDAEDNEKASDKSGESSDKDSKTEGDDAASGEDQANSGSSESDGGSADTSDSGGDGGDKPGGGG